MAIMMTKCNKCGTFYNGFNGAKCPYCEPEQAEQTTVKEAEPVIQTVQINSETYPVVGWLAEIDGPHKGKSHIIHSDNNFIGRSEKMDIILDKDETVEWENHAVLTFDPRGTEFYISLSRGKGIMRLNGNVLLQPTKIEPYDRISIGNTELMFVPLCGEHFNWN